jgi:hypothetical protein
VRGKLDCVTAIAAFFGHPQLTSAEIVLPDLRNSLLVGTRHH